MKENRRQPRWHACPVCGSTDLTVFFELPQVPIHIGVQWASPEEARRCPRSDIRLAVCEACSFITNVAFDPVNLEYAHGYENSLNFSAVHRAYTQAMARHLVDNYQLRGKEIIEIGCGRGDFLSLLCTLGNNRGVGFDPGSNGEDIDPQLGDRITFIRDYFSERYRHCRGDLICCRQAFEHIPDPVSFLDMLGRMLERRSSVLYFETPNVAFVLRELSIWDLIYEHCSYFGIPSLVRVFERCGFHVHDVRETYEQQFLSIEASRTETETPAKEWLPASTITEAAARFAHAATRKLEHWQQTVRRLAEEKQRVALWGGGARGVTFLNLLEVGDTIPCVVDINPRKQGKHVPGTGQSIVPPEFLREYKPDLIIVTNPIYKDEIESMARGMGLRSGFLYA